MKLKYRLLFFLVISFIFVVSFLILEPELHGHERDSKLDKPVDGRELEVFASSITDSLLSNNLLNQGDNETHFVPRVGFVNDKDEHMQDVPRYNHSLLKDFNKHQLIEKYRAMYNLNWSADVGDDAWELADSWVNTRQIHPDDVPQLGGVLRELSSAPIILADVGFKGTQLKLTLTLRGNRRASFKPKWYSREHIVYGRPFEGKDRHNAEIAAYHLQRLLGYNRSPIVVGRTLDLVTDVLPVAEDRLKRTFFKNGTDTCFYGKCYYCKSEADGVCANGTSLEGALVLWLPEVATTFKKWRSPWQRDYSNSTRRKARWESEPAFCDYVRQHAPYDVGPRLMDFIDATVFDYLIGNADRHHYETFTHDDDAVIVMFDSAKSFGNAYHDEHSILAPLYQCCQIRRRTYERLLDLRAGVLTTVLRDILSHDPIAPVLHESHYTAMDARLLTLLDEIDRCLSNHGAQFVLVDDAYEGKPFS